LSVLRRYISLSLPSLDNVRKHYQWISISKAIRNGDAQGLRSGLLPQESKVAMGTRKIKIRNDYQS
jgi:hypothetical protein